MKWKSPPPLPVAVDPPQPLTNLILAVILMALAAGVRLPHLGHRGYFLDELWTSEIAAGHASAHLHLPDNQLLTPPDYYSLQTANPWWQVWTHMEITHPPLYFILLRLWMNLFGTGDGIERLFSVLAAVAAVGVLFDLVRLLNGRTIAIWACILMALSQPQVEHARLTRNYALLLLFGIAAADALVRIELLGLTRRRWLCLMLAVLAALLTHYLGMGTIIGLGLYALIRLRGITRRWTIAAFLIAALVFTLCWGPFMWQQRPLFSTADPAAAFLQDGNVRHFRASFDRLLLIPAELLAPVRHAMLGISAVSAVIYVLPFFLLRRHPALLLWALWLDCSVGLLLGMDLTRQTRHLDFIRYLLLAGVPVYVLIPAVAADTRLQRWVMHALPAAASITCALALLANYDSYVTDPHQIEKNVRLYISSPDLYVFIAQPDQLCFAKADYLMLSRYVRPFPCPIAFLSKPVDGPLAQRTRQSPRILAYTDGQDAREFVAGTNYLTVCKYPGWGLLWILNHTQPSAALPANRG